MRKDKLVAYYEPEPGLGRIYAKVGSHVVNGVWYTTWSRRGSYVHRANKEKLPELMFTDADNNIFVEKQKNPGYPQEGDFFYHATWENYVSAWV